MEFNATKLPITPIPKPRMTRADAWKQRPVVLNYWAYKDDLQLKAKQAGFTLGPSFGVIFFIPMPHSWSQKKKAQMKGSPHQQKPDLDNLEKALMDCLAPGNDSYIWFKTSQKVWSDEGYILIRNLGAS